MGTRHHARTVQRLSSMDVAHSTVLIVKGIIHSVKMYACVSDVKQVMSTCNMAPTQATPFMWFIVGAERVLSTLLLLENFRLVGFDEGFFMYNTSSPMKHTQANEIFHPLRCCGTGVQDP